MCGRFVFFSDDNEEKLFSLVRENLQGITGLSKFNLKRGDVYPSQNFPIIHEIDKHPAVTNMTWGYPPASKKSKSLLINARAETASQKYTFKYDYDHRRCIILATGFYEWSKQKEKNLFTDESGLLYIGGLFTKQFNQENNTEEDKFVILTKRPDDVVSKVHNRMPVLIPPYLANNWLTDTKMAKEIIDNYSVKLRDKIIGPKQLSLFN